MFIWTIGAIIFALAALRAMGVDASEGPLRFTLGLTNSEGEIDAVLKLLPSIVARTTH